jgi:hypothetical protein
MANWLKRLRNLQMTDRQVVALAVCSGLVMLALMIAWLALSTRTAILNMELDDLGEQNAALTDKINGLWVSIGETTSQQNMEQRARQSGYRPPDKTEYYLTVTATQTSTMPVTNTMPDTITFSAIQPITTINTITTTSTDMTTSIQSQSNHSNPDNADTTNSIDSSDTP